MRKILTGFLVFTFAAFAVVPARAQDAATQQQLDKLSGQIQDLQETVKLHDKRIGALEKQVSDLSDKLSQPAVNDYASTDDLKKLAAQLQEIDQKRQDDNQKILDTLDKLGKSGGVPVSHKPAPGVPTTSTDNPPPGVPQKGYEYKIAPGDTPSAIAKAYRAKGVKVTSDQILAANPGLNPNKMVVGKTIFIPDPDAK
ncbi:MAG TPA: LysM peptidoglycan-binding domain-containing protein [Verrucomicrobiae bacterium]